MMQQITIQADTAQLPLTERFAAPPRCMPIGRSAGSGVSNRWGGMLSLGRTWAVKSLRNPGSTRRWRQRLSSGDRLGDLTVLGSSAPYRIPVRGPRLRNLALLLGHPGLLPHAPAQCRAALDGDHSGVGRSARLARSSVPPRRGSLRSHLARPCCFRHFTRRLAQQVRFADTICPSIPSDQRDL